MLYNYACANKNLTNGNNQKSKICAPKNKEARNKILAGENTKDSGMRCVIYNCLIDIQSASDIYAINLQLACNMHDIIQYIAYSILLTCGMFAVLILHAQIFA